MDFVELRGEHLALFLRWFFAGKPLPAELDDIYRLSVAIDEGGVKVKVNEGPWSPALGEEHCGNCRAPMDVCDRSGCGQRQARYWRTGGSPE